MDTKIFLNAHRGKGQVNNDSGLNVSLAGRTKILPAGDYGATLSQTDVYEQERHSSTKFRLRCQINPLCTNVLSNNITEIVKNEGSDDVKIIYSNGGYNLDSDDFKNVKYKSKTTSFWNKTEAINDTQLTTDWGDGHFVYHPGKDIFDNHLLRSLTFKTVCRLPGNSTSNTFNTLFDFMRHEDGSQVQEVVTYPVSSGLMKKTPTDLHLYLDEDLLSYEDALEQRMEETFGGWFGFKNVAKIQTYENFGSSNEAPLPINKVINYKNGGDFIDMYPGRDLYSFVPKFNQYRNRLEKNWNYCLTYPSSATSKEGLFPFFNGRLNSLKAICFDDMTVADNGASQTVIYSVTKHGLKEGDFVNIYKSYKEKLSRSDFDTWNGVSFDGEYYFFYIDTTKYSTFDSSVTLNTFSNVSFFLDEMVYATVEVTNVVDDYIFTFNNGGRVIGGEWADFKELTSGSTAYSLSHNGRCVVNNSTLEEFCIVNDRVNIDPAAKNISFKKVTNNLECNYYVRIFSRLPNFKFATAKPTKENLYKTDSELIKDCQNPRFEFENHVSRLAFANNIYGDNIGQVVFTDDIVLGELKDNLGRPLTSIYLSLFKNNRGYKEWYGIAGNSYAPSSPIVEYSHCFGKLNCALELSYESSAVEDFKNYDIHQITNAAVGTNKVLGVALPWNINNSDEIDYYSQRYFFGDLVCYNNAFCREEVIQPFCYRFNTAQRELNDGDSTFAYFKTFTTHYIAMDDYDKNFSTGSTSVEDASQRKEGYYYHPHKEIKLRSFSTINTIYPDFLKIRTMVKGSGGVYNFYVLQYHYLEKGDKVGLYDSSASTYYYGVVEETSTSKKFSCKFYTMDGVPYAGFSDIMLTESEKKNNFKLFKCDNVNAPDYATWSKDGSCSFIWRDVIPNGYDTESNIEEYPFTNGAFYVNAQFDLPLFRQDMENLYGLWSTTEPIDPMNRVINEMNNDEYYTEEEIKC